MSLSILCWKFVIQCSCASLLYLLSQWVDWLRQHSSYRPFLEVQCKYILYLFVLWRRRTRECCLNEGGQFMKVVREFHVVQTLVSTVLASCCQRIYVIAIWVRRHSTIGIGIWSWTREWTSMSLPGSFCVAALGKAVVRRSCSSFAFWGEKGVEIIHKLVWHQNPSKFILSHSTVKGNRHQPDKSCCIVLG